MSEGIEYSYDCENCKFKDFMKRFGIDIRSDICWIDCTKEIKDEADIVFDELNSHLHMNGGGLVLFDGIPDDEYNDFLEERGLTSQVNEKPNAKYIKKWKP